MFTRIRLLFIIAIFGLGAQQAFAQIKIGDNPGNLDQSAVLELESTTKGFLLPRMTTAQRTAIATPTPGLTVYDLDAKCTYVYRAGTGWYSLCSADSLTTSNGISLIGRDVQLGGTLTKATTIGTNGATNTLTISGDGSAGNNPLTVTNLKGGDQNDSIVTITAATGVVRKRTIADVLKASNADTLVWKIDGNTVDRLRTIGTKNGFDFPIITNNVERLRITSTGLVGIGTFAPNPNTTVTIAPIAGTTDGLTLKSLNLASQTDSVLTVDANGVVHQIPASTLVNNAVLVENGISKTGNTIRLGGALNQPTVLTTTSTNTLAIAGLQHGTSADSLVLADATSGVLKKATVSDIVGAGITADNGLNKSTQNNVQLGGSLLKNTSVDQGTFSLSINPTGTGATNIGNAGSAVAVTGTTSVTGATTINTTGSSNTSIGNATGTITALGATSVNTTGTAATTIGNSASSVTVAGTTSVTGTTTINTTGTSNTSIGNATGTITALGATSVNTTGTAATTIGNATSATTIDGTNLTVATLPSGVITDSLVSVNYATGAVRKLKIADVVGNTITADNGLNKSSQNNIQLGGSLLKNTSVDQATFSLTLANGTTNINATGTGATNVGNAGSAVTVAGTTSVTGATTINTTGSLGTSIGNATSATTVLGTTNVNTTGSSTTFIGNGTGLVAIGTGTTPKSTLDLTGSFAVPIATKTGAYTVTLNDHTVIADCTTAGLTLTLPDPATCSGRTYILVKGDNSGNILTFGAFPIYLATATSISSINYNVRLHIQSDGSKWWLIARF